MKTSNLYHSENLLDLLKKYTYNDDQLLVEKISKEFSALEREVVKYSNGESVLYLKNHKGVRIYEIQGYLHIPSFHIKEHFDTLNKKDHADIKDLFPLNGSKITVNKGRTFYEIDSIYYELRIWTLVAELCQNNLWYKGLYSEKEKQLVFNNHPSHYRDYCFFTSDDIKKINGWIFSEFRTELSNDYISISGSAEKNLFRQKYAEFEFKAKINIKTGDINITSEEYSSLDYK